MAGPTGAPSPFDLVHSLSSDASDIDTVRALRAGAARVLNETRARRLARAESLGEARTCTTCNERLRFDQFHALKRDPQTGEVTRRAAECKTCEAARRRRNRSATRGPGYRPRGARTEAGRLAMSQEEIDYLASIRPPAPPRRKKSKYSAPKDAATNHEVATGQTPSTAPRMLTTAEEKTLNEIRQKVAERRRKEAAAEDAERAEANRDAWRQVFARSAWVRTPEGRSELYKRGYEDGLAMINELRAIRAKPQLPRLSLMTPEEYRERELARASRPQ